MFEAGLVEAGEGNRLQFQAVLEQVFRDDLLDLLHEIDAFFVQLLHRHFGSDGTQGVNELALDQFLQCFGIHGLHTECLGRVGYRVVGGFYAHVELRGDIDAHAITGDKRLFVGAPHLQSQGIHVDRDDLLQYRQDHCTPIHDHLLAPESRADKGDLLRGAFVEARENEPQGEQAGEDDASDGQNVEQIANHRKLHFVTSIHQRGAGIGNRAKYGSLAAYQDDLMSAFEARIGGVGLHHHVVGLAMLIAQASLRGAAQGSAP